MWAIQFILDNQENTADIAESVISFEALYESMYKCKRGVIWKNSVAHYTLNGIEETLKLEAALKAGTYQSAPPYVFEITHPKKRECLSITFRDRVYQRSLNDNQIYPQMCRQFVYDNCACQKGKGTDFARDRLVCHLQRFYRNHGLDGYVLQCDIKGYYPNMRHEVAKDKFARSVDGWTYKHAARVLDEQYTGKVGYNPGSQMIQIAGISVLDDLDHFIKERLKIKQYVRYMDDFLLIHESKQYLKFCYAEIEKRLTEKGFILHPYKTQIYPLKRGIKFLGFNFRVTDTGKVLMLIDKKNVQNEKRKLRRIAEKVKHGEISREKADQMYASWRDHAAKGWCNRKQKDWREKKRHRQATGDIKTNNKKVLEYMDKFYKNLWR
ncbi:MAG: reverse transcriptase domain-containing protein [Candidatus Ornithomonoglobus sp.]